MLLPGSSFPPGSEDISSLSFFSPGSEDASSWLFSSSRI